MKKYLSHIAALLITALLLGLGISMPGLAFVASDRWLLTKPQEVENSVIYNVLSQDMDFMQRLELFQEGMRNEISFADMQKLELFKEGMRFEISLVESGISMEMEEHEVQKAAMEAMGAIGFPMGADDLPRVMPLLFLETAEDKTSLLCVFWYCIWDEDQVLWIDDVSGAMIGFNFQIDFLLETSIAYAARKGKVVYDKKEDIYDSAGTDTGGVSMAFEFIPVVEYLLQYCTAAYPECSVEVEDVDDSGIDYVMKLSVKTQDRQVASSVAVHGQDERFSFNID